MSNDSNYYAAINNKLQNKEAAIITRADLKNKENEITNKLLYYYDKNFDSYYDNSQAINAQIESRDQLIRINNDEFEEKLDIIFVLKYFMWLLLFIIVIGIGKFFNLYTTSTMNIILVLSFIIYVVIIVYKFLFNKFTLGESRANRFAQEKTHGIFANVARDLLPNYITRNRCPTGCKRKHKRRCNPKDPNCTEVDPHDIKAMKTDSTLDFWTRGDILAKYCHVDEKTGRLICDIDDDEQVKFRTPKPWYKGTTGNTTSETTYSCQFEGEGEPIGEQGFEFTGTIPCQYYPGYKTKSIQIGRDKIYSK